LEVVAKAIYLLNFYSGSSLCLATVSIIFTRTLNVLLMLQYNCLLCY